MSSMPGCEEEGSIWDRSVELPAVRLTAQEQWGVGIGGTVWEGGILLAQYLRQADTVCAGLLS